MAQPQRSLEVVGADYPNKRGPGRRFEIELCKPGEPIELRPEPKNPADPRAIAVFSCRGVQLGYLTAERAPLIGRDLRIGREIQAIFQGKTAYGCAIRVAFDGEVPSLPDEKPWPLPEPGDGFYPDPEWPDE